MSKLLSGLGCATTTATAAIPTFLFSNNDSNIAPNQIDTNPQQPQVKPKKAFTKPSWSSGIPQLTSASDIENKYNESDCLNGEFPKISWTSNASTTWDNKTSFGSATKGCLAVVYYKQPYSGGKWWNEFRLVWSLKDDTNKHGFITVVNVITKNGGLFGNAVAYILKKESNWAVTHKKETEKENVTEGNKLKELIPQAGTITKNGHNLKDNWSFNPDLTKICGEEDCETPSNTHHQFDSTWEWETGGQTTNIKNWCNDLNKWIKDRFSWENFDSTITNVNGNWKAKTS